MEMKKTNYQSPEMEVMDICTKSIICASGPESANVGITNPWRFEEEDDL